MVSFNSALISSYLVKSNCFLAAHMAENARHRPWSELLGHSHGYPDPSGHSHGHTCPWGILMDTHTHGALSWTHTPTCLKPKDYKIYTLHFRTPSAFSSETEMSFSRQVHDLHPMASSMSFKSQTHFLHNILSKSSVFTSFGGFSSLQVNSL